MLLLISTYDLLGRLSWEIDPPISQCMYSWPELGAEIMAFRQDLSPLLFAKDMSWSPAEAAPIYLGEAMNPDLLIVRNYYGLSAAYQTASATICCQSTMYWLCLSKENTGYPQPRSTTRPEAQVCLIASFIIYLQKRAAYLLNKSTSKAEDSPTERALKRFCVWSLTKNPFKSISLPSYPSLMTTGLKLITVFIPFSFRCLWTQSQSYFRLGSICQLELTRLKPLLTDGPSIQSWIHTPAISPYFKKSTTPITFYRGTPIIAPYPAQPGSPLRQPIKAFSSDKRFCSKESTNRYKVQVIPWIMSQFECQAKQFVKLLPQLTFSLECQTGAGQQLQKQNPPLLPSKPTKE